MANRYANLPGSAKIKDTYDRINQGFDLVEQDVDQLRADLDQEIADREAAVEYVDQRVDNIIVGGGPDKDPELVDIRTVDPSYTPQREINTAGDVTRDMQARFISFMGGVSKRLDQPLVGRYKTVKEDIGYNIWPVIVRTSTNRLIVFYGRGTGHILGEELGRALCYKYSDSDGLKWSEEKVMLYDPDYDFTTYGACALGDGSIICFVNKYTPTVRAYKVMRSTDNGESFSEVFDFNDSASAAIRSPGYPNVPIEMDNGEIIASKQVNIGGKFGLHFIFSSDGGVTWQKSVEAVPVTHDSVITMPWEVRIAYLGNGRLLALGRNNQGNPYQLVSTDYGMTWDVNLTNIDDCVSHNLFPLYTGDNVITVYYTDRRSNTILKRTAYVDQVFNSPTSWPDSEVIGYTSSASTAIDGGYPTAVTTRPNGRDAVICIYTSRGEAAVDDTSPRDTGVVIVYDKINPPKQAVDGIYRQALINGDFSRWIRGTSFNSTGYTADRWRLVVGSGADITVSRQNFDVGQTEVIGEPRHYLEMDISDPGSSTSFLAQRIEDVRTFSGQRIYYSFYARCMTGTYTLGVYFGQNFGSGGSASVTTNIKNYILSTKWQRFTGYLDIPGISGKTIGSNSYLEFVFRFAVGSGANTVHLARVQVHAGVETLAFSRRHEAEEILLCDRYATAISSAGINDPVGSGFAISSTQARIQISLPAPMRILPTLITDASNWQLYDGVNVINLTGLSVLSDQNNDNTIALLATASSGLVAHRPYDLVGSGASIIFNAEL